MNILKMILLLKNVGQDEIKLVSQLVPSIKHSVFLPFLHTLCKVSQILIIINFQTKQVFQNFIYQTVEMKQSLQ